ncbi:16S rRNA (guanine(966)-N(2))-methyltransferase RsmD [Candidatus Pelagibacter sp.]|uniref:16S rRNA (guanine(966)-N(2))-methyltransferase RsmD n=1 Tax=Candidatus Pelagibacter sp. TaxID=2024849 RepID=UPI003F840F31
MRIIGGQFKGKKLLQPNDKETRPLKDLTKESIFNILHHSSKFNLEIENSHVLDLFSGVGSFGLECISRKAKSVTFVENYKEVLPILKKNLSNLKADFDYEIIETDIFKNISKTNFNYKYDIIFLDPPYKEKDLTNLIIKIKNKEITKSNTIFIIHRHKKEIDAFPDNFQIIEEKKYGIAKIIFGKLKN